jgi:hypothetical protein
LDEVVISFWNQSSLPDGDVIAVMEAIQIQIDEQFAPKGYKSAKLEYVAKDKNPRAGTWRLIISSEKNPGWTTPGFHTFNGLLGVPEGFVYLDRIQPVENWSITASHEVLEMLANPNVDLIAHRPIKLETDKIEVFASYAYEVCDQCFTDDDAYEIGKVRVSNFVIPEWFDERKHLSITKYDLKSTIEKGYAGITKPFESATESNLVPLTELVIRPKDGNIDPESLHKILEVLKEAEAKMKSPNVVGLKR